MDNSQRYQLFPSRDLDDQKILESDWPQGTPGHTQPKVVVFPWQLFPYKKSKMN